MNEIWKTIEGYPDYMVSNMGRVKSLNYNRRGKEKILKGCKDKDGYLIVNLSKEGKQKNYKIHRLVTSAFLYNPNNLSEVNHKDENKQNNCVDNLEWCNRKYNCNYGTHNEKMSKTKSMPVLQFSKTGDFIKKWDSATQVERELGIKQTNITKCLKGKLKTSGGYKWGYADDYELIPFKIFDLTIYRKKVA